MSETKHTAGAMRAEEKLLLRWPSLQGSFHHTGALAEFIDHETGLPELLAAIKGVSNYEGCWCQYGEGNPMMQAEGDSSNCRRLYAAIAAAEKGTPCSS